MHIPEYVRKDRKEEFISTSAFEEFRDRNRHARLESNRLLVKLKSRTIDALAGDTYSARGAAYPRGDREIWQARTSMYISTRLD